MTARSLKPCIDCPALTRYGTRCPSCRRKYERARNAQPERLARYDADHRQLRAQWQQRINMGERPACARCARPIAPDQPWHLDHLDDGSQRPSHATCNSAAGGRS